MTTIIEGGTVVTLGKKNRVISPGAVVIEGGSIKDVGPLEEFRVKYKSADVLDARGKIIMPSFVNVHHHLYSTFARGMSVPGTPARNFTEILEKLWWKLDKALFREAIYYSALIPLMECARKGVTAIIDHHESQSYQIGSLDEIKRAVDEMGMKAVLCLGTSDRYDLGIRGIEENERFLRKESDNVRGMVGLHASFTVGDDTLKKSVKLAEEFNVGIHVHCAEDGEDQAKTMKNHSKSVVRRLKDAGALGPKSLLVHCIHIDEGEMDIIRDTGTSVAHNPESNMNNAVGYSRVLDMIGKGIDVGIGTDGMSSDMLSQMRCAFLMARHERKDPTVGFMEIPDMLIGSNPRVLAKITGWDIGELSAGNPADIITVDYDPATPLNEDNFIGHLLFGMVSANVDTTICNGKAVMRHKKITCMEESEIASKARETAVKVWEKII
ncbi:MAG: putative aminohydrolase SsnA [Elusimicrobia bacterium]|nr:putative aminohydrolase SsnA [Elusimicrobiota bacterium]